MVDLLEGLVTPLEADDVQSCSLLTRMFETPLPPLLSSFHFRQGLGCVMILCVSCDWFHHYICDIHVQHFRMNEHGSFAYLYIGTTVWSCLFRLVMYWLSYWIGHYLIWCMTQVQIFLCPDVFFLKTRDIPVSVMLGVERPSARTVPMVGHDVTQQPHHICSSNRK